MFIPPPAAAWCCSCCSLGPAAGCASAASRSQLESTSAPSSAALPHAHQFLPVIREIINFSHLSVQPSLKTAASEDDLLLFNSRWSS